MSKEKLKKDGPKVLENLGNTTTMDFEALHNLVGIFSIFLEVDKRKNPQKYIVKKSQKND